MGRKMYRSSGAVGVLAALAAARRRGDQTNVREHRMRAAHGPGAVAYTCPSTAYATSVNGEPTKPSRVERPSVSARRLLRIVRRKGKAMSGSCDARRQSKKLSGEMRSCERREF